MSRKKKKTNTRKAIKKGDPRIFFESTTSKPFVSPIGIEYKAGTLVRGLGYTSIDGEKVSISLPSMAELIYYQASKMLKKASKIKRRALKVKQANGYSFVEDEETVLHIYSAV